MHDDQERPAAAKQQDLGFGPADAPVGDRPAVLTKSLLAAFEQCPRRLWLAVHRPELADGGLESTRLAEGNAVGVAARSLLPGGVTVATSRLDEALAATASLVAAHDVPIFEAAFVHEGVLVRVDILEPGEGGLWHLAEVKSSTSVKPHHPSDLATQAWVVSGCGLPLSGASIRHIDRSFVLQAEGEYSGVLIDEELLPGVDAILAGRSDLATSARRTLDGEEPVREVGGHCDDPHPCPFALHCGPVGAGPEWPVSVLPNGGGKKWLAVGIDDLFDVDPAKLKSETHIKVHRVTTTGKAFHDCDAAKAEIGAWAYPRTWLDFETIAFALPRWVGTRPYEQVPFQFSAHIETPDGELDHREFLSLGGEDPRRSCAEALAALPSEGAVIAYNASFEAGVIRRLAELFPDLRDALEGILARIVDLLPVTRACWYHRDQRGSWSIKAVLPTIGCGLDYEGLTVANGLAAQEAYVESTDPRTTTARRGELRRGLSEYCALDTMAMIALARHLEGK